MVNEGGAGWTGRENVFTIESSRQPLGVECVACGHRGLVRVEQLRGQRGVIDMTPVKSLRLHCQCGCRQWLAVLFRQGDDIRSWQGAVGPAF